MIKIGCAAYSYRDYLKTGKMNYEDFIKEAYKIGLDGIELTLYWLPTKEKSYLLRLKRLALYHGLPISGVGISTNFCTPNSDNAIKTTKEGIDIAYKLGAPVVRVFGGTVSEGYNIDSAIELVVNNINKVLNYAEDNGVVLAIENHSGITEKADHIIKIVKKVNSPWLKVNLDLGNYKENTYEEIEKTAPYAVHTHAKVSVYRKFKLDYNRIKEILLSSGYNGFLSIEYEEEEDAKTGVPKFAKYLFEAFK